jgi:hypothetical protein
MKQHISEHDKESQKKIIVTDKKNKEIVMQIIVAPPIADLIHRMKSKWTNEKIHLPSNYYIKSK